MAVGVVCLAVVVPHPATKCVCDSPAGNDFDFGICGKAWL